ncbi:head GIN domain-containing protein [Ulvibacter antarcticus]|uniref:Putative autotransporter adhesin-like protein n=1 Tax=Ulvibacter antarcticus TaxID=442714 RepID=A0A3L9YZ79_9FLAO|nr:head GIN domain-containing protein [Ulvibacter antarcticus]RMA66021.1 putative autotransporter adhesin-like protein [Ulvibacter antarcticus]
MKSAQLLLVFFISATLFAQSTVEKNIGDFNELKVYDLIEVNFIKSDVNQVAIKGEKTESVKVINDNGTLKIRMNLDERFDGNKTFVEVYYTSIDILDANEGAKIVSNEAIEQEKIELRSQEGGRIKVGLQVNHAEIKAVSGGIIEASGMAESQNIVLNTGGIFEGRELQTQDTTVKVTAAGEAEVNASEKVTAKVTAGGDIDIYGNPKEVNKKKFAGGRIRVIN